MRVAELLKEPLVHFLVLGLLLFVYFAAFEKQDEASSSSIEITTEQIQALQANWLNRWRRMPTPDELQALIENEIQQEVYYREGLALGLDQQDAVVRNRMIQKVRFLIDEQTANPTELELAEWLDQDPERYRIPARFNVSQVYLGRVFDASDVEQFAKSLAPSSSSQSEWSEYQRELSVPRYFENVSLQDLNRDFGQGFVDEISALTSATWHAPIISGFGGHAVYIEPVSAAREADLSDANTRQRVENDWRNAKSAELEAMAFAKMRDRYDIQVAQSPTMTAN